MNEKAWGHTGSIEHKQLTFKESECKNYNFTIGKSTDEYKYSPFLILIFKTNEGRIQFEEFLKKLKNDELMIFESKK